MSEIFSDIRNSIQQNGVTHTVKKSIPYGYEGFIRPYLPRGKMELNGVTVRAKRTLDPIIPRNYVDPNPPTYEESIVCGLHKHVSKGERVVIVGGGWGVSTVIAANNVSKSGKVYTYEASPEYYNYIKETVEMNGVEHQTKVINATVSHSNFVYGNDESSNKIDPDELPDCDVLELDCEGAEIEILKRMTIQPDVIIVETHGKFNAPTDEVISLLEQNEYEVVSKEPARKSDLEEKYIEDDIFVVIAEKTDS